MKDQLLADIGLLAEGPAVDAILAGTYKPPAGTGQYECLLLSGFEMPAVLQNNPMPPPTITRESHQTGWSKQKEHTSGEPSAVDFSISKAAAQDNELAEMDTQLRSVPSKMASHPQNGKGSLTGQSKKNMMCWMSKNADHLPDGPCLQHEQQGIWQEIDGTQ